MLFMFYIVNYDLAENYQTVFLNLVTKEYVLRDSGPRAWSGCINTAQIMVIT